MMRHIMLGLFLSSNITIFAENIAESRKPLKQNTKEAIDAARQTINGALGIVVSKDDRDRDEDGKQEFDNAVRELATGIANLVLVGVHQKQNNAHRTQHEVDKFIQELIDYINAQIKDLSL